jgi:hypothetical protein
MNNKTIKHKNKNRLSYKLLSTKKGRLLSRKRQHRVKGGDHTCIQYTLLHTTGIESLLKILESGHLKSAKALGQKGTEGESEEYIYMTITDGGDKIPVPYFGHKSNCVLHFDFGKLIKDFPDFFINEGNSFGPLNGENNKRVKGSCVCRKTFNTMNDLSGRPCAKKSLDDILKELVFDFDHCDGGPEIGFKTDEIPLHKYLQYVTMYHSMYMKHEDIIGKYSKYTIIMK